MYRMGEPGPTLWTAAQRLLVKVCLYKCRICVCSAYHHRRCQARRRERAVHVEKALHR